MRSSTTSLLPTLIGLGIVALAAGCKDATDATAPATGAIEVTVASTGIDIDPDGYSLRVDSGAPQHVASSGSLTLGSLAPGDHLLHLEGVAANCDLAVPAARTVTIVGGTTTAVRFDVTCAAASSAFPRIAFASTRDGTAHIYRTNAYGSVTRLTDGDGPAFDAWPTWSPDGKRIAFERLGGSQGDQIYIINADGYGLVRLPGGDGMAWPAWSPDGASLLGTDLQGLRIVNVDGSGARELPIPTTLDGRAVRATLQPRWSPDGRQIAVAVEVPDPRTDDWYAPLSSIEVMNADGTGRHLLTAPDFTPYEYSPAWSPDGRQIAFWTLSWTNHDIVVMNVDRSGQPRAVNLDDRATLFDAGFGPEAHLDWSPDGLTIAVVGAMLDMPTDGILGIDVRSGVARLLVPQAGGRDFAPAWSPVQP